MALQISEYYKNLDDIMEWYLHTQSSINETEQSLILAKRNRSLSVDPKYLSWSDKDIRNYFKKSMRELDHVTSLSLLAATEAILRIDYSARGSARSRIPINQNFRIIYQRGKMRAKLDDDIIETWKQYASGRDRSNFSQLLGKFKYRHWLAHGRYWDFKLSSIGDIQPDTIYNLSQEIDNFISTY